MTLPATCCCRRSHQCRAAGLFLCVTEITVVKADTVIAAAAEFVELNFSELAKPLLLENTEQVPFIFSSYFLEYVRRMLF